MDIFQFPAQFPCSLTECFKKSPFQGWICFRGCGISAKGLCSLSLPQSTHRTTEMSSSSLPNSTMLLRVSLATVSLLALWLFCLAFLYTFPRTQTGNQILQWYMYQYVHTGICQYVFWQLFWARGCPGCWHR